MSVSGNNFLGNKIQLLCLAFLKCIMLIEEKLKITDCDFHIEIFNRINKNKSINNPAYTYGFQHVKISLSIVCNKQRGIANTTKVMMVIAHSGCKVERKKDKNPTTRVSDYCFFLSYMQLSYCPLTLYIWYQPVYLFYIT